MSPLLSEDEKGSLKVHSSTLADLYPTLLRWSRRLTQSREEAEDLCQEILLHVLSGQDTFRHEAGFSTWLFSITINTHKDFERKKLRRKESIESDLPQLVFRRALDKHISNDSKAQGITDRVHAALSNMSERQRQLLNWKYVEGRSHAEIAKLLGIQERSAWCSIHRAREAFKRAYLGIS